MNEAILLAGAVILICILMNRLIEKIPVPSLLIFIALGICFGENGVFRIVFNDYAAVNLICSVSLIFIMFYGGFGTNLQAARPVLAQSVLLSTAGVAATAGAVGIFAHFALGLPWLESLLIGSVISSTDAASVFNILRTNKLALKYHTDSLLEVESGSNDPMSYMLTTVTLSLMAGQQVSIPLVLLQQISLGLLCGFLVGKGTVWLLRQSFLESQQNRTVLLFAVMLLAYALPAVLGGNGYLSVYLCGILLGNTKLSQKRYLVHFFDVLTDVSQVIIFFLLGLLVTPTELPALLLPALGIMLFLTFVARPAVVTALLLPFRARREQIGIVSWAGLRGAASIVFAISAVLSGVQTRDNLFNLVFCIVLFSIALQGTLLPKAARYLGMIDDNEDVAKTFNDYQAESDVDFIKIHLGAGHPWCGHTLREAALPPELLVTMIVRGEKTIVPDGATTLCAGDLLVLAARAFEDREHISLHEVNVERSDRWANKALAELPVPEGRLVILIKRGVETMIPTGRTVIKPGDTLVLAESVPIGDTM
ncbi:potassium/proton antiporter [Subdoligranulum variabile]|uniref:TrkA C-terminal domain protein n=1 Tax=Subdoligranulum variabile DSM 15176 TaxID=411471 RepID=D1PML6_9FIRM|nr:potassium/proton antiporter [Subdoligranulum variabile]EFB75801.1 TrkA C-terminal domain protein [Subdoligranulum variabile DSM 15176]UWP68481.1 potassium/proton antiporter [Subdoligranulum variabile]